MHTAGAGRPIRFDAEGHDVCAARDGDVDLVMEDLQAIRPRKPRRGLGRVLQQRVGGPDLRGALAVRVDPPDQRQGAVGDIEPAVVVGDAVGTRAPGGKEVSRQIGEQRLLAVWRYLPDTEVCRAARPDADVDVALVIQGDAGDAGATRAVLAGLDLLMQRQERQGRLGAVRGDLPDLTARGKADIDVAMAVDLDALRRSEAAKSKRAMVSTSAAEALAATRVQATASGTSNSLRITPP